MEPADTDGVVPCYSNLGTLALIQLLVGMTNSFMSPFYSMEAVKRGMSITEAGMVYSCIYLVTIVASPFFGKCIERVGSRNMLFVGTLIAAIGTCSFGFLCLIEGRDAFFGLSLTIKIITSVAVAATSTAVYPLTINAAGKPTRHVHWEASIPLSFELPHKLPGEKHKAKALGIMDSLLGFGILAGPLIGGVLFKFGGFFSPFLVTGGTLSISSIMTIIIFKTELKSRTVIEATKLSTTNFQTLSNPLVSVFPGHLELLGCVVFPYIIVAL